MCNEILDEWVGWGRKTQTLSRRPDDPDPINDREFRLHSNKGVNNWYSSCE